MRTWMTLLGGAAVAAVLMTTMTTAQTPASLYDLQTTTLTGKAAPLSAYKGQVTLVVNTASQCGFTPQYARCFSPAPPESARAPGRAPGTRGTAGPARSVRRRARPHW